MNHPLSITHIPLSDIQPSPLNPRKHFDEAAIIELAASILVQGVLQPIMVRLIKPGKYEIVAGERRYRASLKTQLVTTIPCIIRELNEEQALDIMIIENLQRKDIHPMEEANGFKQIMDIKDIDIKEMAARVGKDARYVAQRLKLCDLVPDIQAHFYKGLVLVKDALTLSQLKPEDQQDFYARHMHDTDERLEISHWEIDKYQNRLDRATFDITDNDLLLGIPACTECPYNSASAYLFPTPDQVAICNDSACFRAKCDRSFEINLAAAAKDPALLLITGQRWAGEKIGKDVKALIDAGMRILQGKQYTEVDVPEAPVRSDFDHYQDQEEADQDYQDALKEYDQDMAAFRKQNKSRKHKRAFICGGDRKGQYALITIDSENTAPKEDDQDVAANPDDMTQDDIREQIERIQSGIEREEGFALSERWEDIRELCDPVSYISAAANSKLSFDEVNALALAILEHVDFDDQAEFRNRFLGGPDGTSIPEGYLKSPHFLADLIRYFIVDDFAQQRRYSPFGEQKIALAETCLAEHFENAIDDIGINHRDIAEKRNAERKLRIKQLEEKLSPKKKGAKKAKA